jgi:putative PEP-CTERM system histidine kinase
MLIELATCWGAAVFSAALALAVVLMRRRSIAAWCFIVGILVLAVEGLLAALSLAAVNAWEVERWQTYSLLAKSLIPVSWLAFSLSYSRGDYRGYLTRWRWLLLGAALLPVMVAVVLTVYREPALSAQRLDEDGGWYVRYAAWGKWLQMVTVAASVCVLAHLERTFRAAVGTMQWRIKFVVLGLGLIFGARIYCRSQALLFSSYDLNLSVVENSALIMGCLLMVVGYARHGFGEIDIYPSRTVLQGSVVVLLVGLYLFVVGVLAQMARVFGGTGNFQLQALVVLGGVVGLAILLLSERLRQRLRVFVSRHFRRPQHDYRAVWTQFTHRLSSGLTAEAYQIEAVRLVAGTFNALSVTLWLIDDRREGLVLGASTARRDEEDEDAGVPAAAAELILNGLRKVGAPFDLDEIRQPWAEALRHLSLRHFRTGGNRIGLPLVAGGRGLGLMIIADRVNGVPYSVEEMELLKCIADHVAAGLLQLRLTEELMHGRELEAFQSMSTFFVHDLKNAASSLSLMLQNLPEHFDDPAFREDALRGIASTVNRINQIIERLGSLRQKLELRPAATDLNRLVEGILTEMGGLGEVEVIREMEPIPPVQADAEQLTTVVTNLLLNAREALGRDGRITIATSVSEGRASLSVSDNGRGMSPEFISRSLFRPFQTTKKKGLGIGMFQSKLIVEAHQGLLQVQSAPGRGTTFRLLLPLPPTTPTTPNEV